MAEEPKPQSWWHWLHTLPGVLTTLAGIISGTTALIAAFNHEPAPAIPSSQNDESPASKRISLKGAWIGSQACNWVVFDKDDGKSIEGHCDNEEVKHRIASTYVDSTNIEITITRIDQDNCETKANGYIKINKNGTLTSSQDGWGGCGLNFGPPKPITLSRP